MRARLLPLLLLIPGASPAEDADALDALLAALARPLPTSSAFVEWRESALLTEPLLLTGELRHPDADTLVREVRTPYAERSTIRAERVEVMRADGTTRRFSLRNAPELAALLASFRAVLGGDRALLERHYRVALEGTAAGAWKLTLTPPATRRARRIDGVVLYGRGGELACLEVEQGDGGGSRMLVGTAATTVADDPEPDFACHCDLPDGNE